MKRIILLWLFLLKYFLSTAQSIANYTVYYDFKCISDTTENTFFKPQEFMLLGLDEESRFMSSGRYYNDSVIIAFRKEHPPVYTTQEEAQKYLDLYMKKTRPGHRSPGCDYRIIKNFKTGNFIAIITFLTVPQQYMEEPMDFAWKMTNETDTILGLPCTKAVTDYGGRHYEAWFTSEVPINDGPYVFRGLPGLILKVIDDQGWYNFTATNIITEKTNRYLSTDWLNEYSQKIDRKTFVDKMIRQMNNPPPIPGVINFTEEDRLKLKERYARRFDLLIEQYYS